MGAAVTLFLALFDLDKKHLLSLIIPVWISIGAIVLLEKKMPYHQSWKPNVGDIKIDGLYFLLIQSVLPQLLVWFATLSIIRFIGLNYFQSINIWPSKWSTASQEVLLIFVSDFLRYWLHRFYHTIPFLWRFHAVHHSVQKMYWLNTARFHPFEKATQFLMDTFPFMLLGVSEKVIALHLIVYGVNGFFQHSNINLRLGWFNYIISSPELHRWHHSKKIDESNNNYGNNVSVWDLLFGTFFFPKNNTVQDLGLINRAYPQNFTKQMVSPLVGNIDKINLPETTFLNLVLNFLLRFKIYRIKRHVLKPFLEGTENCDRIQHNLLMQIINNNENTRFGVEHHFKNINNYQEYREQVTLQSYESLLPYISSQAKDSRNHDLIADNIILFNKTSGTTSEPKLIPVTQQTLNGLKESQDLMVYNQYLAQPYSYYGKIVGIASPAIEGMTKHNIPIGSASGQFYKSVSAVVRTKYVIPYEVLEIKDYEIKYYTMLLCCLQHKDITYIATANPTTLLKLIEVLNTHKQDLLNDLCDKSIKGLNRENFEHYDAVVKQLNPSRKRIKELENLFKSNIKLTFEHLCPYLMQLATWTGGSCGTAIHALTPLLPPNVSIIDLGYLSSELRATITFDKDSQSGLPTYTQHFFEFVERIEFENGIHNFKLLHEVCLHKEYYIFVTTSAGLYRYNMNDIVVVTGFINRCPLLKFLQKGKGVCNITGEKLYESQLLTALNKIKLESKFIQVLANEDTAQYELYVEENGRDLWDTRIVANQLDLLISDNNIEYQEKRHSGRLKPLVMFVLREGASEEIKKLAIKKGQSEGQYKTILLTYKKMMACDLSQFIKS